ncbi:hypothetical protein [Paenibacillus azoreducens]|uniref:triacylglycerol lipase n=2 Tax=Paenibacillus azoreducens TaxID=116718 RepID=A0A920CTJ3_9BACL|nr:hypothetical protein [Paenibacillus azoreducens]GIO48508.1 hypothetical protein J34TS1_32730 [Paenibacillus azoreducens]
MTYINDKTYWVVSGQVYKRDISVDTYQNEDIPDWKIIEPKGALLHDTDGSGFDANVFYNEKTNQIIIGYRGTEPPDRPFWSKLMDYETDFSDVMIGRKKNIEATHEFFVKNKDEIAKLPIQHQMSFYNAEARYQNNQFTQAQNLYDAVKKEYPTAEISTTGHSLGGAEAEYVAVMNGLNSVSFNAPNIVHLLPDDLQDKSKSGEFRKTNIAYVNPKDSVGSGISSSDRHVGETYHINSNYTDANKTELKLEIPFSMPIKRDNAFSQFLLGPKWTPIQFVPITLPMGQQGILQKLYNSFLGEGNHSLDYFTFDEKTGNIANKLFTMDGNEVQGLPRVQAYEEMLAAREKLNETLTEFIEKYGPQMGIFGTILGAGAANTYIGNKSGKQIQLTPEELQKAASQMKSGLQAFASETRRLIQLFETNIRTSESRSLRPIAENASAKLSGINRWYQESITEIANYIDRKAKDFIIADQS